MGGQPVASSRSSRPHRPSAATAGRVQEMRRHRVAGERGSVHEQNPAAGTGQEHRQGRSGAACPDHDHVVCGGHGATLRARGRAPPIGSSPHAVEPVLHREQRGGGARRDADLRVGVLDVAVGGLGRDAERAARPAWSAARARAGRRPRPRARSAPPAARSRGDRLPGRLEHRGDGVGVQPPGARLARRALGRRRRRAAAPGAAAARSSRGRRRRRRAGAPAAAAPRRRLRGGSPEPSSRSWWAPATGASAARNGERESTRSEWYACSLTCSHSSGVSGPGFCQMRAGTATRPTSWTQRRPADRDDRRPSKPQRSRGRRRQLAPRRPSGRRGTGETRSAKSPIAASARSIAVARRASAAGAARTRASPPTPSASRRARGSRRRRPRARAAIAGSNAPPARSRTTPRGVLLARRACAGTRRRGRRARSAAAAGSRRRRARPGSPLPSQRSVKPREQACDRGAAGRAARSASAPPRTARRRWRRWPRAARGSRRAI